MSLPNLFVVGDSISLQYGPYLAKMVEGRFEYERKSGTEEALKNIDKPIGGNGGPSNRVLEYLQLMFSKGDFKPDILLLNCGLHDIIKDRDSGERANSNEVYLQNLKAIVELIQKNKTDCIWIRTTPVWDELHAKRGMFHRYNADVEEVNAIADRVFLEAGIPLLDLYSFTLSLGENIDLFSDGVHFLEDIRRLQAAHISGYLSNWLNTPNT